MSSRVRTGSAPPGEWPVVLRSGDGRARIRPWWRDPSVAQLTFIDHGAVPSSTAIRVWLAEMRARGFTSVRTGAVTEAGADLLHRQGFEVLQALRLLDLSLVGWRPEAGRRIRTRRLRTGERDNAADTDRAAFGDAWAIDTAGIGETCDATPSHRARAVDARFGDAGFADARFGDTRFGPGRSDANRNGEDHNGLSGFAITGRADHTGYLQRLAVHPAAQGRGIGLSLTFDSLVWMQRRRLTRAVVNTHADNDAALALYRRVGFRLLPQGLAVLTRRLDDV